MNDSVWKLNHRSICCWRLPLVRDGKSLSFVGALVAEIIYVVVSIVGCLAIVIYATWLLVERLRAKDKPPRSFGQWLKHVFEGVMGL